MEPPPTQMDTSDPSDRSALLQNTDNLYSDGESKPEIVRSRPPRFIYVLTITSAIGGLLFGYDTGVVSGALLKIKDDFHLSAEQQEMVVSSTVGTAILGAALASYLADSLGRRPSILLSSLVFAAGALLMGLASSYEILVCGRAVVGFAIGIASMVIPVYLAETAPTQYRGTIVTVNVLFITGGQFFSGIIDGAFSSVPEGWRIMLGLSG